MNETRQVETVDGLFYRMDKLLCPIEQASLPSPVTFVMEEATPLHRGMVKSIFVRTHEGHSDAVM